MNILCQFVFGTISRVSIPRSSDEYAHSSVFYFAPTFPAPKTLVKNLAAREDRSQLSNGHLRWIISCNNICSWSHPSWLSAKRCAAAAAIPSPCHLNPHLPNLHHTHSTFCLISLRRGVPSAASQNISSAVKRGKLQKCFISQSLLSL